MRGSKLRFISVLLVAFMALALVIPAYAATSDVKGHYAEKEIEKWTQNQIFSGYSDNTFKPNKPISREEFVWILNKIFKYIEKSSTTFDDVPAKYFYGDVIAKAVAAGTIVGDGNGKFRPSSPITRQEAASIIAKAFNLKAQDVNAVNKYTDAKDVTSTNKQYVSAMVEKGYLSGWSNKIHPNVKLTRAHYVKMLDNIIGDIKNTAGTYTGNVTKSLVVNTGSVILKDMTIAGDLYLTSGIGSGDVTLDNVVVKGRTIVSGGGENSIVLKNTKIEGTMIVIKKDGKVRVVAQGSTEVANLQVESGVKLEEDGVTGKGFGTVEVFTIAPGQELKLDGDFEEVVVQAENATIKVLDGKVDSLVVETKATVDLQGGVVGALTIDEKADGTSVTLDSDAKVTTLTADAPAQVSGTGAIETANINVSGVTLDPKPTTTNVANGVTAQVGGQEVTGTGSNPLR